MQGKSKPYWCSHFDLNEGHTGYEPGALPLSYENMLDIDRQDRESSIITLFLSSKKGGLFVVCIYFYESLFNREVKFFYYYRSKFIYVSIYLKGVLYPVYLYPL